MQTGSTVVKGLTDADVQSLIKFDYICIYRSGKHAGLLLYHGIHAADLTASICQ